MDKRKRETMATLTNGIEALRRKIDEQDKEIDKLRNTLVDKKEVMKVSNTADLQANMFFNAVSKAIGILENATNYFIACKEAQAELIAVVRKVDGLAPKADGTRTYNRDKLHTNKRGE